MSYTGTLKDLDLKVPHASTLLSRYAMQWLVMQRFRESHSEELYDRFSSFHHALPQLHSERRSPT